MLMGPIKRAGSQICLSWARFCPIRHIMEERWHTEMAHPGSGPSKVSISKWPRPHAIHRWHISLTLQLWPPVGGMEGWKAKLISQRDMHISQSPSAQCAGLQRVHLAIYIVKKEERSKVRYKWIHDLIGLSGPRQRKTPCLLNTNLSKCLWEVNKASKAVAINRWWAYWGEGQDRRPWNLSFHFQWFRHMP